MPDRNNLEEWFILAHGFKEDSSPGWEDLVLCLHGMESVRWLFVTFPQNQKAENAGTLLASSLFPFYSVWDSSPWNSLPTFRMGLPTSLRMTPQTYLEVCASKSSQIDNENSPSQWASGARHTGQLVSLLASQTWRPGYRSQGWAPIVCDDGHHAPILANCSGRATGNGESPQAVLLVEGDWTQEPMCHTP